MKIASTKVMLNAAFLCEIKEDNRRLRELLQATHRRFSQPSIQALPDLTQLLWQLRDQLAMHFALENAYGYLADVIDFAPRLCDRALAMLQEHDDLFLSLCEMIDCAEELRYDGAASRDVRKLAEWYMEFHEAFFAHEDRENELMFDALNDDIGVGD